MVVDKLAPETPNPTGRTMHTNGKMFGLTFEENWYIVGESDGSKGIPAFKLVAYKGTWQLRLTRVCIAFIDAFTHVPLVFFTTLSQLVGLLPIYL